MTCVIISSSNGLSGTGEDPDSSQTPLSGSLWVDTIYDREVSLHVKGKFYHTTIDRRHNVIRGGRYTRQDMIRNKCIREKVGVAPIAEKNVESRLK
ncbi:hypothetical protein Lal_00022956 [Lupinus albus]|nr:hypothetical protein Lal_00022956 [Lupinus albus]